MSNFSAMIQIVSYLSIICLLLSFQLVQCISLDPSVDSRFWKNNSSNRVVLAKNLVYQSKDARTTGTQEVSANEAAVTSKAAPNTETTPAAPVSSTTPIPITTQTMTVSPAPDNHISTTPSPRPENRALDTFTLLFVLAIILFMLILIAWIVCQYLVKESAHKENTEPITRDTQVNTISSDHVTVEPQTIRSEMLVKSPMKRAKAGEDDSQRTESRVQMSKMSSRSPSKKGSKENVYVSYKTPTSHHTTTSTGFPQSQASLQSNPPSSVSNQASLQTNQASLQSNQPSSASNHSSSTSNQASLASPTSRQTPSQVNQTSKTASGAYK